MCWQGLLALLQVLDNQSSIFSHGRRWAWLIGYGGGRKKQRRGGKKKDGKKKAKSGTFKQKAASQKEKSL
jgi:hypothetical protein